MKNARVLKFAAIGIAFAMLFASVSYWVLQIFGIDIPNVSYSGGTTHKQDFSGPVHGVFAILNTVLFAVTMLCIARLASAYEKGDFFSVQSVTRLRHVAMFLLLYAVALLIAPYVDQFVKLAASGTDDLTFIIVIDFPKIGVGLVAGALFGLTRILEQARAAVLETQQFL